MLRLSVAVLVRLSCASFSTAWLFHVRVPLTAGITAQSFIDYQQIAVQLTPERNVADVDSERSARSDGERAVLRDHQLARIRRACSTEFIQNAMTARMRTYGIDVQVASKPGHARELQRARPADGKRACTTATRQINTSQSECFANLPPRQTELEPGQTASLLMQRIDHKRSIPA